MLLQIPLDQLASTPPQEGSSLPPPDSQLADLGMPFVSQRGNKP